MENWLLRLYQIARRPPSPKQAMVVAGILALVLGAAALEAAGFWPAWADADKLPFNRLP